MSNTVVQEQLEQCSRKIIGTGCSLPVKQVFNDAFTSHLDTSDEWIQKRVGIASRHIASDNESTVELAYRASVSALKAANITSSELDVILVATVTPDQPLPCAAVLLAQRLGDCSKAFAFDIRAACSGFLVALSTADGLLQTGGYRNALVVGAENLSKIMDWSDRTTCVLFGDGAGAVVLQNTNNVDTSSCIKSASIRTYAEHSSLIERSGGSFPQCTIPKEIAYPAENQESCYVKMNGKEVFRTAIGAMVDSINSALTKAEHVVDEVDWFVPHQSNKRMIEAVCEKTGLSIDKTVINIERVGNTSAASIPIALDEAVRDGRIKSGDLVLMTAVGSGITCGSMLVRW